MLPVEELSSSNPLVHGNSTKELLFLPEKVSAAYSKLVIDHFIQKELLNLIERPSQQYLQ